MQSDEPQQALHYALCNVTIIQREWTESEREVQPKFQMGLESSSLKTWNEKKRKNKPNGTRYQSEKIDSITLSFLV